MGADMVDRESPDSAHPVANAIVQIWDAETMREVGGPAREPPRNGVETQTDHGWWNMFEAATALIPGHDPIRTMAFENATCVGYHEYCARAADPSSAAPEVEQLEIAYGSGTTAPTPSDTSLTGPITNGRVPVSQYGRTGSTLTTQSVLYESELTGATIAELGLVGPSGNLWNHALLPDPVEKSNGMVVNVTVSIVNQDASEVSSS